jgi:predicted anti-sigma-YlaC factor YlaD
MEGQNMECQNARSMIPSYCDGELTQAQAGPLRQHLLGCQPCRGSAQDLKNLKRWFAPAGAAVVPAGFAARVARRALQGDTGELVPGGVAPRADEERGRLLRFVLACTAAAAVVLLLLAIGVRQVNLPRTDRLQAAGPPPQLERALEELDRLNRAEKAPQAAPHKP